MRPCIVAVELREQPNHLTGQTISFRLIRIRLGECLLNP
jgi:hypothetical protein